MKHAFPLLALFLATACSTTAGDSPAPASAAPPETAAAPAPADPAAADARLVAFLDAAFDEAIATSPETLTALGMKTNYDRLDDYTDAQEERQRALAEAQLARMKAGFDNARSEEHTSELQSRQYLVCRLLLEK